VTSNYIYRRYTRSDDEPSAQLDLHLSESHGLFAGAWFSRVKMDSARIEINPYAGAQYILTPDWRLEAALQGYLYSRHVFNRDADYAEAYATFHFRDLLSARLSLAMDAYGSGHGIVDAELLAQYPITDVLNPVKFATQVLQTGH
jgi:uncharacterized protein (TIGR02001 family)